MYLPVPDPPLAPVKRVDSLVVAAQPAPRGQTGLIQFDFQLHPAYAVVINTVHLRLAIKKARLLLKGGMMALISILSALPCQFMTIFCGKIF